MEGERLAGGLRCSQVLELLPDAMDGTLCIEDREKIAAHLAECSTCERFGGQYAALVHAIREENARETISAEALERVMARLRKRDA